MAKAEVKLNDAGMRALLNSGGVVAEMGRRAAAVAAQAGDGYRASSQAGKVRARGSVITTTIQARRREAKTHALVSALSAASR